MVREGELERGWFRSERLIESQGKWFIRTREGADLGPFPSTLEACSQLEAFIAGTSRLRHLNILTRLDYFLDCSDPGAPCSEEVLQWIEDNRAQLAHLCGRTQAARIAGMEKSLRKRRPQQRVSIVLRTG